jgi:mRNA-degrading endonuclease toxin of MazEF toxin-antitoxin module
MPHPARGEIWGVDLSPVLGHEQGGQRPALVVSVDAFNSSARTSGRYPGSDLENAGAPWTARRSCKSKTG